MLEIDRATLMISTTLSVGLGIAIGWALRGRAAAGKVMKKSLMENLTDGIQAMADSGEIKLVLVVNNELKMGKGKIAAQCAHAAVGVVERSFHQDLETLKQWRLHGQPKVVVKADSTAMLKQLGAKAQSMGLVTCLIADAGRTQIAPGSKTVLGVGPVPKDYGICAAGETPGHKPGQRVKENLLLPMQQAHPFHDTGPAALVDQVTGHLKLL